MDLCMMGMAGVFSNQKPLASKAQNSTFLSPPICTAPWTRGLLSGRVHRVILVLLFLGKIGLWIPAFTQTQLEICVVHQMTRSVPCP